MGRFQRTLETLPRRPPLIHAANSAAALRGKLALPADLVRPGIYLYGGAAGARSPQPVAALRARVVAVRSLAAGDTVGYGASLAERAAAEHRDAWRRVCRRISPLGPRLQPGFAAQVELNGRLVPLVARVTMDMCMVRWRARCAVGDVATVFGGLVSLDQQAEAAGTISYELLTRLGPRVTRRYGRSP